MANFNLDPRKIEEAIGPLMKVANGAIIDAIDSAAGVLRPMEGENEIVDDAIAKSKAMQENYNSGFLSTLNAALEESHKFNEIAEFMEKKASLGDVSNASTEVATGSLDPDALIF